MNPFTTCLWFDTQAEDAAHFYTRVFPDSVIRGVTPYPSGERAGQTMTVDFTLNGAPFVALNGGPEFSFSEAVSFQVPCEHQDEIDRYWDLLTDGGEPGPCGWLKDRFGVSWQVVPERINEFFADPTTAPAVAERLFTMTKIVIAELEAAALAASA